MRTKRKDAEHDASHLSTCVSFVIKCFVVIIFVGMLIMAVNRSVDCSGLWSTKEWYEEMARLSLGGETVKTPDNYQERLYQICAERAMTRPPDVLVIGSSRGMYLGDSVMGLESVYNCCVSGACLEDYYALVGLYEKGEKLPNKVVLEVSPWVLHEGNPEKRWLEVDDYSRQAQEFYYEVTGGTIAEPSGQSLEFPDFLSIPYFQANLKYLAEHGLSAFCKWSPEVAYDSSERAELPDGTIRYPSDSENESDRRTAMVVGASQGAVVYESSDSMVEVGKSKAEGFERLLGYLVDRGCDVTIYLAPFSASQSERIYQGGLNGGFLKVELYLRNLADEYGCKLVGGYNAADFDLGDERFIDNLHADKLANQIVWDSEK